MPVATEARVGQLKRPKGNGHPVSLDGRDIAHDAQPPYTGTGLAAGKSGTVRAEYRAEGRLEPWDGAEAIIRDKDGNVVQRYRYQLDPSDGSEKWMPL